MTSYEATSKVVSGITKDGTEALLNVRNYAQWKESSKLTCTILFGFLATVFDTNVEYVEPATIPSDWMPPPVAEGNPAYPAKMLTRLYEKAEDRRLARIAARKDMAPKFFAWILQSLSTQSKVVVTKHIDYSTASLAQNPNSLFLIIRETHLTNVSGGGPLMKDCEAEDREIEFNQFRQTEAMSISDFYQKYRDFRTMLNGMSVAAPTGAREAVKFLKKLDRARHGDMVRDLENAAKLGTPMPATLEDAYRIAGSWKVKQVKADQAKSAQHSAYVLAEESSSARPPTKKRNRPAAGTAAGQQQQEGEAKYPKREKRAVKKDDPKLARPSASGKEWRTCRGCNKPGHLFANCPDNPSKDGADKDESAALVAIGEESDIEEGDERFYEGTFLMAERIETDSGGTILFANDEILLDNQASRSLFRNVELLHSVGPSAAYRMSGIDSKGEGVLVDTSGSLNGLSRIDGTVGVAAEASANILSFSKLRDAGYSVKYRNCDDSYVLEADGGMKMVFTRRVLPNGRRSGHYSHTMRCPDLILVQTVADNMRRYTQREVKAAQSAVELQAKLGHPSLQRTIDAVNKGIMNCRVTANDLRNAEAIFGKSSAVIKGKTNRKASRVAATTLAPRVVQVQQKLGVDFMFVKDLTFLIGVLSPLGLCLVCPTDDRTADTCDSALDKFLSIALSRGFDVQYIECDGEKGIAAIRTDLERRGHVFAPAGPGQHVPVVERMIQTVKKSVRAHVHDLPFVMSRIILKYCVIFCVSRINMLSSGSGSDGISPLEQFSGRKLDAKVDLRVSFGDYVQATSPTKDNSMGPNTHGCIALLPAGNLTGTVRMWCLGTRALVNRDQFTILPMGSEIIKLLNDLAEKDGYTRESEAPGHPHHIDIPDDAVDYRIDANQQADQDPNLPTMQPIPQAELLPEGYSDPLGVGVDFAVEEGPHGDVPHEIDLQYNENTAAKEIGGSLPPLPLPNWVRRSNRAALPVERFQAGPASGLLHQQPTILISGKSNQSEVEISPGEDIRNQLRRRRHWQDPVYAFKMSVRAAMKDRPEEARVVIMTELQQMVDKRVWHGVDTRTMTKDERRAVIRSSMFLKDKYLASGAFEKFKARLVAGGDQQDKSLYEDLAAPTALTCYVLTVAAVAAMEHRIVEIIDIGGAFLNADLAGTGVKVRMRLGRLMTALLVEIDPAYGAFMAPDGTSVVELDKALYGCVEAAAVWYRLLRKRLEEYGLVTSPCERCVFNRSGKTGDQMTITLHVDDLMVTSKNQGDIDDFKAYLRSVFPEIEVKIGAELSYLGMLFNFGVAGEVRVTMNKFIADVIRECGVTTKRSTPATEELFNTRKATAATEVERSWFRTYVAKMLYLAKRVRPECLLAVSFLSTRVLCCDIDDLAKLRRLLGYLIAFPERGIVLRIGKTIRVRMYIDAAYGVHESNGRSHGAACTVIGDAGPVDVKSGAQKNVTKSSTEAELVALSDHAGRGMQMRTFLEGQGYQVGPVILYQDNLSCMALIARGGPTSERSRHINIRFFWVAEKVKDGSVTVEHLPTELMFINVLTKPEQGKQFRSEAEGLTNWPFLESK